MWRLIDSIRGEGDQRLIQPFGLSLKPGHIVSVNKSGDLSFEGTSQGILGVDPGDTMPPQAPDNILYQHGEGIKAGFRASGQASTLFPDLPTATAGIDISFASADSWILALNGRQLLSLNGLFPFRQPILDAYRRNVWEPSWVLVKSVVSVQKMTLLAAENEDTQVALSLNAAIDSQAALEAKLTSAVTLVKQNKSLIHRIVSDSTIVFFSGIRVKGAWWREPSIEVLDAVAKEGLRDALTMDDSEFWEDAYAFRRV